MTSRGLAPRAELFKQESTIILDGVSMVYSDCIPPGNAAVLRWRCGSGYSAVDRGGKYGHVPGLCDDDVVEGVVLVAKAGKSDPENHCVGYAFLLQ
jgi:hypothetical protein